MQWNADAHTRKLSGGGADRAAILAAVDAELRPVWWQHGQWLADYKRLRIVAEKPA